MKTNREGNEVISCKICGEDTTMLGTRLCNPCWELDTGFRNLVRRDKGKAHDWLHARVAELAGYRKAR